MVTNAAAAAAAKIAAKGRNFALHCNGERSQLVGAKVDLVN